MKYYYCLYLNLRCCQYFYYHQYFHSISHYCLIIRASFQNSPLSNQWSVAKWPSYYYLHYLKNCNLNQRICCFHHSNSYPSYQRIFYQQWDCFKSYYDYSDCLINCYYYLKNHVFLLNHSLLKTCYGRNLYQKSHLTFFFIPTLKEKDSGELSSSSFVHLFSISQEVESLSLIIIILTITITIIINFSSKNYRFG